MSTFYPDDAPVPQALRTGEFVLRPLRPADNPLDYDAVMESREQLLLHSLGRWPHQGFTSGENLADLQRHERDFGERLGFTYTIMHPHEPRCLGCLYIYPLASVLRSLNISAQTISSAAADQAHASFWVRTSRLADDLDRRVLVAILPWLRGDFAFPRFVLGANAIEERQVAIFHATGMRRVASYPVAATEHQLFA
jgi:hypothetical protein